MCLLVHLEKVHPVLLCLLCAPLPCRCRSKRRFFKASKPVISKHNLIAVPLHSQHSHIHTYSVQHLPPNPSTLQNGNIKKKVQTLVTLHPNSKLFFFQEQEISCFQFSLQSLNLCRSMAWSDQSWVGWYHL